MSAGGPSPALGLLRSNSTHFLAIFCHLDNNWAFLSARNCTFALYFLKVEIKFHPIPKPFNLLSFYENLAFIFSNIQPYFSAFCDLGLLSFDLPYRARKCKGP